MSKINWKCSVEDTRVIIEIARKARLASAVQGLFIDQAKTEMDITAWHCNEAPLDLLALCDARECDLLHDVLGIQRHISRSTGKRKRGTSHIFSPRYTRILPFNSNAKKLARAVNDFARKDTTQREERA